MDKKQIFSSETNTYSLIRLFSAEIFGTKACFGKNIENANIKHAYHLNQYLDAIKITHKYNNKKNRK